MSHDPVFYDPRARRWRNTVRWGAVFGVVFAVLSTLFVLSLFVTPLLPNVRIFRGPGHLTDLSFPNLRTRRAALAAAQKQKLLRLIASEQRHPRRHAAPASSEVVFGFYVNWEDMGLTSLRLNLDKITHFMPEWLFLDADGFTIKAPPLDSHDPAVRDAKRMCWRSTPRVPIVPMIKNYAAGWDTARLHRLLVDRKRHREFAEQLRDLLVAQGFQGINVDFESIARSDRDNLTHLMSAIYGVLHPAGLLVTQDVQAVDLGSAEEYAFDLPRLSLCNDYVVYMAYDEHEESHEAGPIAGVDWFRKQWAYATEQVPSTRLVLAMGNYGYDWPNGKAPAKGLTYQAALTQARESHEDEPAARVVQLDEESLNPHYEYEDDDGTQHEVWMLNAVTCFNEWKIVSEDAPAGVALWYMGAEDPSIWSFLDRARIESPMDASLLERVTFPYQVDYQGDGEILRVTAAPQEGSRVLSVDQASGLITGMAYQSFPSSFVLQRSGKQCDMVALTFDDGPDGTWTPLVLDALERAHCPATFFLVGKNVELYPDLVRREWREGHELGNHTFNHPNLSYVSEARFKAEFNATQRAIEALTGHTTLEFRPPYNADAEPRSEDEVRPLVWLRNLSKGAPYVTVGESVDPKDWDPYERDASDQPVLDADGKFRSRTADDIASYTINQVLAGQGNVALLHDAGGNRAQTVLALPRIIAELRARGWRFVTVSELERKHDSPPGRFLNPPMDTHEKYYASFDVMFLNVVFGLQKVLYGCFLLAILIGVTRIAVLLVLTALQVVKSRRRTYGPAFHPLVSVVIAAYNEAKVIARTVDGVLASQWPELEVIVVDDGSSDGTADVLEAVYGGNERVQIVRQPNTGKAGALNHGMELAHGEIIVSLDADTVFGPETIPLLVRHFGDPEVGAVAGNVKVGNRLNVLTRWQAIEYITSQNLDRRAYALLNAVTVVPGAVGAWRREAIEKAGGYTSDTLAEDTDLTWKIRRQGWRFENEPLALAWTEAPDTLSGFFRQRFRWTFGTLQCLWKHRSALGRHGWFGRVALPFLWIYQFLFQILSPLIDLQVLVAVLSLLWALLAPGGVEISWVELAGRDLAQIAFYYSLFFVVELLGAVVAFLLDGENPLWLWWLFIQRFVYRQLMYAVVFKTLFVAIRGTVVGWGKLERKNTVQAG